MSKRKIFIGSYQIGYLAGISDNLYWDRVSHKLSPIDFMPLFYSCMIQAGIEEIQIGMERLSSKLEKSDFNAGYFTNIPFDLYSEAMISSMKMFFDYRDKAPEIKKFECFFTDLLYSFKSQTSMACITPIPNLEKIKNVVKPNFYFAIKNLFSLIRTENIDLPIPQKSIQAKDFLLFQKILSSDLFDSYVHEHSMLEDKRIPIKKTVPNIIKTGNEILKRDYNLLRLKKLAISILPLTSKLINIVCGNLLGSITDYLSKTLTDLLSREKRIIIYQFNPLAEEIYETYKSGKQGS